MNYDITKTIQPKSDQLNADSLIAGPLNITVTSVTVNADAEQPVTIAWEGGDKTPYKPSKSMRRVIATVWGVNSQEYLGKSMTLYRDPTVRFGGQEVGGIKISHMTGITTPQKLALTATRGKKELHTVQPLTMPTREPERDYEAEGWQACLGGVESLKTWFESVPKAKRASLKPLLDDELKPAALAADAKEVEQ